MSRGSRHLRGWCLMAAGSALLFAGSTICAQDVATPSYVVVKTGTPVWVFTSKKLVAGSLKVGDPVPLQVLRPVRAMDFVVVQAGEGVDARVVAVEPELVVRVEPLRLATATVAVTGSPVEWKKGKLVKVEEPDPVELASHYRMSAGDAATIAGVGIAAAPIVALASPFLLIGALHHEKEDPLKATVPARHIAMLRTAADVRVPTTALEGMQSHYAGPPVVYLVDHMQEKHRRIFCGGTVLLGEEHAGTSMLRVDPGAYNFRTENKEESAAVLSATADHRYLVYRDKQGLHAADLEKRPELMDRLSPTGEKTVWVFDTTALPPEERSRVEADRARGGCGLLKVLHSRPAGLTSSADR